MYLDRAARSTSVDSSLPSDCCFVRRRVEKYAEENPEEAALQAGGLALGFVLLAWGLFSLRKPRRVRIIGV